LSTATTTGARTLPARYYTDESVFRDELERFFWNSWICAGRAAAIPNSGDYFLRDVGGESIIIVRESSTSVRAYFNVCRHRGTRMCTATEGHLTGRIQCPYHGWTYGLDGELIGAPHMDVPGFSRRDYPLRCLPAKVWEGHIFIHLGRKAPPLLRQLGDLARKFASWRMAELRLHKRLVYNVKANWKLVIQNYNECLHCPLLHPALNHLTEYLGADNEPPADTYIGGSMGFRNGAETMSIDGRRVCEYLPALTEAERKKVCYYAVYPNLLLSLHPDYMMLHTIWPKEVDRTEIICEWHFHPSALASRQFAGDSAVQFWDQTNREDWHIIELSQSGIASRAYTPGPYSPRESLLHAFDEFILQRERERRGV
jgi:glycine betaine catabolism A